MDTDLGLHKVVASEEDTALDVDAQMGDLLGKRFESGKKETPRNGKWSARFDVRKVLHYN